MKNAVSLSIYVATFLSTRYAASALLIALLDVPHQLQFTGAHVMFNFPANSLLYIWFIYSALRTPETEAGVPFGFMLPLHFVYQ